MNAAVGARSRCFGRVALVVALPARQGANHPKPVLVLDVSALSSRWHAPCKKLRGGRACTRTLSFATFPTLMPKGYKGLMILLLLNLLLLAQLLPPPPPVLLFPPVR